MFETDVMLLPLGGCELVLGIQWLSKLGTIQWNFKDLRMQFEYMGKKVILRGTHQAMLAWLSGKQMSKVVSQCNSPQMSAMCYLQPTASLNLMRCTDETSVPMEGELKQLQSLEMCLRNLKSCHLTDILIIEFL